MGASKLEVITGTPPGTMSIARCFGASGKSTRHTSNEQGHGVAWKTMSGANIKNLRCPEHNGPLYQTTRNWQTDNWTVVPLDIVARAAGETRAAKRAAQQKLIDAGTHRRVRDLQPGDLFTLPGRGTSSGGRLVEVRRDGSRYVLVVSYPYNAVVSGHVESMVALRDAVTKLEALTWEQTVPGDKLVQVSGWEVKPHMPWATPSWMREDFRGWAVDDKRCLVELWQKKVDWLEEALSGEGRRFLAAYPSQRPSESDEAFAARKERARRNARDRREAAEADLAIAKARLAHHTI